MTAGAHATLDGQDDGEDDPDDDPEDRGGDA